jgi:DNA polymerase alpha-associated DNA helicase A
MLQIQYRFNSKINAFPSKTLYDGELRPDEAVKDRKLSDLEDVEEDEDLDEPVVFIDSAFPTFPSSHIHETNTSSFAAAGQAMHERSSEDGSFGSESKSNENEAEYVYFLSSTILTLVDSLSSPSSIVFKYVQTLVRLLLFLSALFSG